MRSSAAPAPRYVAIITDGNGRWAEQELQKLTDSATKEIDDLLKGKEGEILEV